MNVDIDEVGWTNKGLGFVNAGTKYRFVVPNRSDVVEAKITSGQIEILSNQSSAHKALAIALGLNG